MLKIDKKAKILKNLLSFTNIGGDLYGVKIKKAQKLS